MKKIFKRTLATVMVVLTLLTSAPLNGFADMDWDWLDLGVKASAATEYTEGYYTYTVTNDEATITDVETSINGDVTIPDKLGGYSVTAIGESAFEKCYSLTSVTIPDSVIKIGSEAFYACHSLGSINIPESVKTLENGVFYHCSKLRYINVDADNTEYSIGSDGVLFDKNKTTLIRYPAGKRATYYTIPDSVTTIGDGAFSSCESLVRIGIPDSITTIGDGAFSSCESLAGVTIPNSVVTIGKWGFSSCKSLTEINIPKSVKSIGNGPFSYCSELIYITVDADNTAYSNDSNGVLLDKNKTTLIQYPAGKKATSYTMPDSVITISNGAFSYCDSLESIVISDNVTTICEKAFYSCDGFTSITIPDKVTTIGASAFSNCSLLENITIPDSVTTIGEGIFSYCYKLASVDIGKGVTSIATGAFDSSTKNLVRITVDANNTAYSSDQNGVLFNKSKTILIQYPFGRTETSYSIPDSVETIYESAFYECGNLQSVTIGKNVTNIGARAFAHCGNLASINIPYGVSSIGDSAFAACSTLVSVILPDSVRSIGNGAFASCSDLTRANLPDSIIKVPDNIFSSCTNLKSVTIPDGVKEVGDKAFANCSSLECISFPESLTKIHADALYKCDSLKNIYYRGTEEKWNKTDVSSGNNILLNGTIYYNYKGYIVGDIIQFGSYPQSEVTDSATVTVLNNLAPAWENWTSYGYYSGDGNYGSMVQGDWMRYADITYNGAKYRGVKFTQYRPWSTYHKSDISTSHQKTNGYETGNIYWFKFEPIYWRVLDSDTGLVLSENVIDCQPFNNLIYKISGFWADVFESYHRYYKSPSGGSYANDYAPSYIRNWLNNDFINIAFAETEKKELIVNEFDNKGHYSYNRWDYTVMKDKVFLLSERDVNYKNYGFKGSDPDSSRLANASDYSKIQGLKENEKELYSSIVRTSDNYSNSIVIAQEKMRNGDMISAVAVSTCSGIRPAIKLGFVSSTLGQTNQSVNTKNSNPKITITPKDASGSLFDDTSSFSAFAANAFESMSGVKVNSSLGESVINGSFSAVKSDIESEDIVLSRDNYYNYIIPKEAITSWSTSKGTTYKFDAYMQKDKKNGKPYVSTVFGRRSDGGENYTELTSSQLIINGNEKSDIIISAGNTGKTTEYYLSQNSKNRIKDPDSDGIFSALDLNKFDSGKSIYAYVITDGITSDPVKIKLVKSVPMNDYTRKLLSGSEISLVGPSGQKIKISDDFPLVGGAEISLEALKVPLVGVSVNGNNVRISLGIDVFTKKNPGEADSENTWFDFKKGISTLGDKYKDSKDALNHYRNFAKTFVDKNGLKQASYNEDSSNLKLSFLGYLEGTIVNGELVFKEALVKVEGKYTFKYTQQGAIWVIPAYVYVEASSAVGMTGKYARQFADTNIPLDFGLMLDINPALKVGAGAGVKNAVSIGLWGKGSMPYHNDFTEKYHNLSLKGEFGWEAEFFIVSAKGTFLEGELKLLDSYYGQSTYRLLRSFEDDYINNPAAQPQTTVSVVSRDYADDTSEWLGEYPISLYSLADNGVTFNVLQTSIFDQTNPQLVSFGDNVMMTWIQDDTSRDTYNRMRLVYSLYDVNNSTWSEPKAVYDDGHNDAYPSLATDGENVYVTWQKIDKTVTADAATSIDVFLENSEIYVAKYDAVNDCFVNATKLTDNEVYDYMPSVVVNNGNAVIYYTSNSNNNLMGTDNNTLYRHEFGKSAEILADDQSYIISATPEIVNGTEKLSYSVDTDGDMSTSNDITVNTISDGTTTAFDKDENEVAYTFADYSMLDGTETLFVSDMNNIYYEQDGETKTVFNGSRLIEGNISFVEQETGLSILWTENNEVGGNEFWTTSYEDGSWTEPVQISNIGAFKVSKVDVAMLGGKLVGVCNMNEMTLDEESGTYTEGEANLCSFTANDFTDISVDIYMVDESTIIPGETSSIDVYVNNVGTTDVTSIEFALSDTLGTNTTVTKEVNIKSGATELVTLDYLVPENYAATTLAVSASIPDVEESDTEDNTESIEIGKCDLSIVESELVNFGDNYILKAVVENNSAVDADGVVVSAIFNDSEEEPFEQSEIGTLAKEQYVDYELAFNKELIEFDENGVGKLYVKVTSASDESADGDNQICVAVTLPEETKCAHPLTETVEAKQATCTEVGYNEHTVCNACQEKIGYEEIPATNHANKTQYSQQNTTCTEIGYTAGEYCPDCEKWVSGHEEIPALDHSFSADFITDTDPTYTQAGSKSRHCTRENCDAKTDVTAIPKLVLGVPQNLKASSKDTTITLTWDKVDGATGYRVYRYNNGWKSVKTTAATSYTVTGLTAGTSYRFAVKAYTKNGSTTIWAPKFSEIKTATAPVPPTTVKQTAGTDKTVTVKWDACDNATGYRVYKYNSSTKKWEIVVKATTKLTAKISGLSANRQYYIAVKPYTKTGSGYVWGTAFTKILVGTAPATPTIRLASTSKGKATIAWNNVAGEKGYQVYYSTSATSGFKKISNYNADVVKAYKTGLISEQTYYFKVRSYRVYNGIYVYSPYSTVKSVKIK